MQKASKSNTVVILNKNQILDNTWKFKSFNVEEGKALNLIIQLKISKNQNEILEKSYINLCLSGTKTLSLHVKLKKIVHFHF